MKKANVTIPFDEEKLRATRFYVSRKGTTLEDELGDFLQKTYEKYVPRDTREFLEQDAVAAKPKGKAPPKPGPSTSPMAGHISGSQG